MRPDFLIFNGELVIVGDFLPDPNWLLGVDHDLILTVNLDHFGIAVWLRRREDETFSILKKFHKLPTSQQWLMNLARLPHLVASTTYSRSIRNK